MPIFVGVNWNVLVRPGNRVAFEQQVGHEEGVDHVTRRQLDLHGLADGQLHHGRDVWGLSSDAVCPSMKMPSLK